MTTTMALESTFGLMAGNTMVNGKKTCSMGKEFIRREMARYMKAVLRMIRNMDRANAPGPIENHIMVAGSMVYNTEQLFCLIH